jgi:hypothetical protein
LVDEDSSITRVLSRNQDLIEAGIEGTAATTRIVIIASTAVATTVATTTSVSPCATATAEAAGAVTKEGIARTAR